MPGPQEVLTFLPDKVRLGAYIVLGILSLVGSAGLAFWAVSPYPVPWWWTAGLAGLGVLLAPFAAVAGSNVNRTTPPKPDEQVAAIRREPA